MFKLSKNTPSGGQGTTTLSDGKLSLRAFIFSSFAAVSLALAALPGAARADDGPSEEYFESLNDAGTLVTSVDQLANSVNAFSIPSFFCKPPEAPQKADSERTLSNWRRQQNRLNRQAQRLSQVAVRVSLTLYASDYEPQVQLVRQILVKLANIRSALYAKRAALQAVPERDCSDVESAEALGSFGTAPGSVADMSNHDALIAEWLTAAQTVKADVDNFHSLDKYCKPPYRPNKQEAEEKLQVLERLVKYYERRMKTFFRTTFGPPTTLRSVVRKMNDTLKHERMILDRAEEVDCGPKQSSVRTPNNQDLGYALMNAMQNNPYKSGEGVTPALNAGYGTDVLYDAETANHDRTRDVLQAVRRDKERQDYGLPNVYDVDSSSVETQTEYIKVPRSQVGETANATDNPAGRENIFYDEPVPPEGIQVSPNHLNTRNLQLNVPNGQEAEESVPTAYSLDSPTGLVGFGTSSTVNRAARTGRNPRTGEPVQIPASLRPQFKAGKGLED